MSVRIAHRFAMSIGLVLMLGFGCSSLAMAQTPITLHAVDGATIYGYYYGGSDLSRPIILLFHQAGANAAEYAPIAPRLVKDGFDCLAIDQRAGGSMFDATNQTAEAIGTLPSGFLDVLKDMNAALDWARTIRPKSKIVLWGSSYSAALVFLLAKEHPGQIWALLSFSPGEYLTTPAMVATAAAGVTIPVFITCAMNKQEEFNAHHIYSAVASSDKTLFVPKTGGVHGSSTLRTDRDPDGSTENWQAVEAFLSKLKGKPVIAPLSLKGLKPSTRPPEGKPKTTPATSAAH